MISFVLFPYALALSKNFNLSKLSTSQNGIVTSGVACNPLREAIFIVPLHGT